MEVLSTVDTTVTTFLNPVDRLGLDFTQCPILKLVFVIGCELGGPGNIFKFPNDFVGVAYLLSEGVSEAGLDEADGEVSDIDADPGAIELLRNLYGGATTAKRVKNDVAFVAACFEDSFKESFGLLGG